MPCVKLFRCTVAAFAPRLVDDAIGPVRLEPMLAAGDARGVTFHRLFDAAAAGVGGLALDVLVTEAMAALAPLDGPCRHTLAVRRAIGLLRERLDETIALDELAAHARLDKFWLCRAFRAEVGLPPHAYLVELRVLRAKALLASGTRPRDVAPLVGFYDQSQLTKHFRRIVGTTPARWANFTSPRPAPDTPRPSCPTPAARCTGRDRQERSGTASASPDAFPRPARGSSSTWVMRISATVKSSVARYSRPVSAANDQRSTWASPKS